MDRSSLIRILSDPELEARELFVNHGRERRLYRLVKPAGHGQTAVTWRAVDSAGRPVALKFVTRDDYQSHSIDSELSRVSRLNSPLIAGIDAYGTISNVDSDFPAQDEACAIVVQWQEGPTLAEFLAGQPDITPEAFCHFAKDLCEIACNLAAHSLVHNDLHERNIVVVRRTTALNSREVDHLIAIDTGQLKSETKLRELLDQWNEQLRAIAGVLPSTDDRVTVLSRRIVYFERTDLQWITKHLVSLYNRLRRSISARRLRVQRFLDRVRKIIERAAHPDAAQRCFDARQLYNDIDTALSQSSRMERQDLQSPFDLISAEMFRSDKDLMGLLEEDYLSLRACRADTPVYIYGPRGCGKSTILRSLSLAAILASPNPEQQFTKAKFIGIYFSCSQEFRTRFWLAGTDFFQRMTAKLIRYFSVLLVGELVDTLQTAYVWDSDPLKMPRLGLTEEIAHACCEVIRSRLDLPSTTKIPRLHDPFARLRTEILMEQDRVWADLVHKRPGTAIPDPQVIFDVADRIGKCWPLLIQYRLAFLLDDYSNQRIPSELQQQLNQVITFSRKKTPIFKVSSEHEGLDLNGIDASREVVEINMGQQWHVAKGAKRYRLLTRLLERRFDYLKTPVNMKDLLGLSGCKQSLSLARTIIAAKASGQDFHYHGIDTLADVCSGNLALGIDILRKAFENDHVEWQSPRLLSTLAQHNAILSTSARQFEYLRFRSTGGQAKWRVADELCQLVRRLMEEHTRVKEGTVFPRVATHIDIAEIAVEELERHHPEAHRLFRELISRGVLISIQTSRSRRRKSGTLRFVISRILLAKYVTALGRDVPIKIDDCMRLLTLLTDPEEFAKSEVERLGSRSSRVDAVEPHNESQSSGSVAKPRQRSLFADDEATDAGN